MMARQMVSLQEIQQFAQKIDVKFSTTARKIQMQPIPIAASHSLI